MVAVVPPLLSDAQPSLVERAGFGDRFRYWRGRSGRRYLFTAVTAADLDDFRSAIVILADLTAAGRLAAREVFSVDARGRFIDRQARIASAMRPGTVMLVHLLAATEAERRQIVDDFAVEALSLAA